MSNNLFFRQFSSFSLTLLTILITLGVKGLVIPSVVEGAENISFTYTPVVLNLRVDSLELFADTGEINRNLETYFNLAKVNELQKQSFRLALTTPVNVDGSLISRILNTDEGERLLDYFGSVINVERGGNGKSLLRGAIIQSALEPDGFSLLNVLQNLALDVQVDVPKILDYSQQINQILETSALLQSQVIEIANHEASNGNNPDYARLKDLRQMGNFKVNHETIDVLNFIRSQRFSAELYYPTEIQANNPVIVISHGLGSKPEDFAKRAKYLASHGYVVMIPQHYGSDFAQTKRFIDGLSRELFFVEEFINRPLTIQSSIDELERLNRTRWQNKLNLQNVGVWGHSFGGYTALAVGGATIDWKRLEGRCSSEVGNLNTALLLQCRALKLPQENYNFRDPRIGAVFVMNAVNEAILGPDGLNKMEVPLFMSAGSYDPATPFVFEVAQTYPFLNLKNSYLQLQEGQAHVDFSQLDAGISDLITTVTNLTLPSPTLLDDYTNVMTLAFFETHLRNNSDFQVYLQAEYAQYLSEGQEFKTYLVSQKSIPEIRQVVQEFLDKN